MSEFNKKVIKEFRENAGIVGGFFDGRTLLLLHNTGIKSGKTYVTPLICYPLDEGAYVIVASAGGSDKHPHWYHNIVANPDVTIEVGTETLDVVAIDTEEPERTQLYEMMETIGDFFTEYKHKAQRVIPVIKLLPR